MSDLFDSAKSALSTLRGGREPLPIVATIPPDHCLPPGSAGDPITKDQMYFTVRVNELHLAENRRWWHEYDPLVVVVTEFNYERERVAIPTVVGPNLIRRQSQSDKPVYGTVLLDTRVTGPHPYRGGDVDISVSFYAVERVNYAKALLKCVDSLSDAIGGPAEMGTIAKTGSALLAGLDGLLGLQETKYLAGHRVSTAFSPLDPFRTGFSVLITPPTPDIADLRVDGRRLQAKARRGDFQSYRQSDYVLLSIIGGEARGDENLLPFYALKMRALEAVWDGAGGVKRAKANMAAAYQEMRRSPDLTAAEAGRLLDLWLQELGAEQERASRVHPMSATEGARTRDPLADDLDAATARIGL
jgi:hypothetical protein